MHTIPRREVVCVNKGHLDSTWQLNSTLTQRKGSPEGENGSSQQVVAVDAAASADDVDVGQRQTKLIARI